MTLPSEKPLEGTIVSSENTKTSILSQRERNLLDVLAIVFWIYATVKLFVFDFDLYLVHIYAPNLLWATQLRFVLIIGFIGLLFLFFKTQTIGAKHTKPPNYLTTSISPTRFLVGFTVIRTSCPSAVRNSVSRPT